MSDLSQNYLITMSTLNSLLFKNPKNLYDLKSNARIIEQQIILAKTNHDTEKIEILTKKLEKITTEIRKEKTNGN